MRFVHIADVHLGMGFHTASFGAEKGGQRRREIKETLLRVIHYCEEEKIDLLLVAGDLFEEDYVSISELMDVNEGFSKLTVTKVMIGAGNHDPILDDASPFRLIQWADQVHVFDVQMESVMVGDCNTMVWGHSWNKKHLPPFEVGDMKATPECHNILMLHGDLYQKNEYMSIDSDEVKGLGMDYIALGHIHKPHLLSKAMAYPGSLEPLDFSESGNHGFVLGEITEQGCQIEFIKFAKRAFLTLEVLVDGTMTYEGICLAAEKSLKDHSEEDYFRLILTGDTDPNVNLDLEDMKQRLSKLVHYVEIKDETQLDIDLDQLKKEYEGSLISAYIDAMTEKGLDAPVVAEALKSGLRILLEEQVMS